MWNYVFMRAVQCGCFGIAAILAGSSLVFAEIEKTTYTYKKVGDLEIKLDVYRDDGTEVQPVVVWIHGGALIMGNREGIDKRVRQEFAGHGKILVSLDYRLAPETRSRRLSRIWTMPFSSFGSKGRPCSMPIRIAWRSSADRRAGISR